MKTAALIPCRTGSKGIPGKNFKDFNGKPLWRWTYEAALESGIFDKIILSSDGGFPDSDYPENVVLDNDRKKELCADDATTDQVLTYYAYEHPDIGIWCILQVTSPLRTAKDIKDAFNKIKGKTYDSLVSVVQNPGMIWIDKACGVEGVEYPIATYHIHKRPMRQDRQDWFMENGAVYFTKRYVIEQMHGRLGGKIILFPMNQKNSLEIDTDLDWKIAEFAAKEVPDVVA